MKVVMDETTIPEKMNIAKTHKHTHTHTHPFWPWHMLVGFFWSDNN